MALLTSVQSPAPVLGARRERAAVKSFLWRESTLPAVRACGRRPIGRGANGGAGVTLKASTQPGGGTVTGWAGLQTCGSAWACPDCAWKIANHRAHELADAVAAWEASGGWVGMVTLTMAHHKDHPAAALWSALSSASGAVVGGAGWLADQRDYGYVVEVPNRAGELVAKDRLWWTRTVEVTHGVNGWHIHAHYLVFMRGDGAYSGRGCQQRRVDARHEHSSVCDLAGRMFGRWRRDLVTSGLPRPSSTRGVDAKRFKGRSEVVAEYLTKATADSLFAARFAAGDLDAHVDAKSRGKAVSAGYEAAAGALKTPKNGNRTPWMILADAMDGDADDLALWGEFERASKGKHQLRFATGMKRALGLGDHSLTDEEVAAQDLDGEEVLTVLLHGEVGDVVGDPGAWGRLLPYRLDVQELVESGNRRAAAALLRFHRVPVVWHQPPD